LVQIEGSKMTNKEKAFIRQKIRDGFSNSEVALLAEFHFGKHFNPVSIAGIKYREVSKKEIKPANDIKKYSSQELPEDNYMICSDLHAPFYSQLWVDRYLAIARKFNIKKEIIVGDLFDFSALSSFSPITDDSEEKPFSVELEACQDLIKNLAKQFDKSFLVSGNHERRVFRTYDGSIPLSLVLNFFPEIQKSFYVTPYDKIAIGEKWLLVHPVSYSQISGNVAFKLAAKFRKNILSAHGHFCSLRYDASGENVVCDLGGLFDIEKINYINLKTTTHPLWDPGFALLYKSELHLFHKFSPWKFYLGEKHA